MQRFRSLGISAVCVIAVIGSGIFLWKSGTVPRIGAIASNSVLRTTALAGFKVDEVLVTGRKRVSQQDIIARLDVRRGMPVFAVDLDAARESLMGMPWVKDARFARRLPGTLIVDITEREPMALWQRRGKVSLVDEEGVVLTDDAEGYGDLPMVVGDGAAENLPDLMTLLRAEPRLALQTASATRMGGRRWDLHLKNGITVMLPEKNPELATARLSKAGDLLNKNVVRIDLRIDGRITVDPAARKEEKKDS